MTSFNCCFRFRVRNSRRAKKIAFWMTTATLCMLVMIFNDVTIQMMQDQLNNRDHPDAYKVANMNVRYPKAISKEDDVENNLDLPLEYDPASDLVSDLAPSTLHYLWCGKRPYEFRHFLALKSAVRVIKPDKVFFHYEYLPTTDSEGYYQWFSESMEITHLILHRLNNSACHNEGHERYLLIMKLLYNYGGIYVPEASVLVDFPVHLRSFHLVTGVYARTPTDFEEGIMAGKRMSFKIPDSPEELQVVMAQGREQHGGLKPCASEYTYNTDRKGDIICVNIERELYPKDIWYRRTKFATLSRVVMYGTMQIKVLYDTRTSVPRIAHYISLADPFIKFTGYLSMLSSIYVAGFQKVFIHGPVQPQGIWWNKLSTDSRFVYVYREFPETEQGEEMSVPMATCVMRIDILLKYGGVYNDYNVLWTQKIPSSMLGYDAIISPDWHVHGTWPESANHATIIAKRNSVYLKYLRQLFQKFPQKESWFIDHYLSYHVIELHPEVVNFNFHLQVKCLNHNCHPTWQGDYRSTMMQNKPGRPFDWQNDTLSLHWVDNFPELDPDMIRYTSGTAVQVARNILKSADIAIMDVGR